MLRLFAERHRNKMDMTRIAMFRILESVKLDVLGEKTALLQRLEVLDSDEKETIDPIIAGIDARVEALEGVEGGLNVDRLLSSSSKPAVQPLSTTELHPVHAQPIPDSDSHRNVRPFPPILINVRRLTTASIGNCGANCPGVHLPHRRHHPRLQGILDIYRRRKGAWLNQRLRLLESGPE
jgi:hypothetical protein